MSSLRAFVPFFSYYSFVTELQIVELVFIGLAAGIVGGMLGIGGSVIMIPAMTEMFGANQHLYQAAAMIVNFFVVVPAVLQHRRAGAVDGATVARLIPLASAGMIAGVALSELPFFAGSGEAYLRGIFGLFLLAMCAYDIYRLFRWRPPIDTMNPYGSTARPQPESRSITRLTWSLSAIVAIPAGLVGGLLGIGGGALAVPLQRRFLHLPIRNAIANSAALIIPTSLLGASIKNYAYYVDHRGTLESFGLALVLIPTAMIGSFFGSRGTHRLPLRAIKVAFFILLSFVAIRLTVGAARDILA